MANSVRNNLIFYLEGDLWPSGASCPISVDVENSAAVEIDENADATMIAEDGSQVERFIITCTGGVMTIVQRGIKNDASETTDNALKKQRYAGQKVFVTIHAAHTVNASANNIFSGDNTFSWTNTFTGIVNLGALGDLNVLGTSNPWPTVADEAARDLLYPTPDGGDAVRVVSLNAVQVYNDGTVQWESFGISTPPPNSAEGIYGVIQLATVAEALAGVNDSNAVTPYKLQAVIDANIPTAIFDKTYIIWENSIPGQQVHIEIPPTFAQATSVANIGDVIANTRFEFPIFGNGVSMSEIKLWLKKFVSPGVDLKLRLETDNNGSPSGTTLWWAGEYTILTSGLTTSIVDTTILLWSQSSQAHGVTLNTNETSQTAYKGIKITLTEQINVVSVTKVAACTATTAYLYDINWNLLTSAAFSTNTATLNYTWLTNWESYYVLVGSWGSSYTSVKQTGSAAFPYSDTKLDFIGGANFNTSDTTNSRNVNATNGSYTTWAVIQQITALTTCKIKSVGLFQFNTPWASRVLVYDSVMNLLWQATVIGTTATFSTPISITSGEVYNISVDNNGSWWYNSTRGYSYGGTETDVSWVDNAGTLYNVSSVVTSHIIEADADINNIVSLSVSEAIIIPDGQRIRWVLYAWTYGSETVNATNYFGVAYSTKDTTTRGRKLRNWSAHSAASSGVFTYVYWTGIHDRLLSLTDADFSYKTLRYGTNTETISAGWRPAIIRDGIDGNQSWLTYGLEYFLSQTPGGIVATTPPTVNICKVGITISETDLDLRKSVGTGLAMSNNTVYFAGCDGMVNASAMSTNAVISIIWYGDTVDGATTIRASWSSANQSIYQSISFAVKKWQYFKFNATSWWNVTLWPAFFYPM